MSFCRLCARVLGGVSEADATMLSGVRKVLNDWATGKFSDRHYEAHKAMRRIQELNDAREVSEAIAQGRLP